MRTDHPAAAANRSSNSLLAHAARAWQGVWLPSVSIALTAALAAACGGAGAPDTASPASLVSPAQRTDIEARALAAKENPHFGNGSATLVGLEQVRVNTTTNPSHSGPDIAALASGGFVVAWNATWPVTTSSPRGIFSQRYDEAGATLGPAIQVTGPSHPLHDPAVTGLAAGGHAVAWQNVNIYARSYDAAGQPRGAEIQANTTSFEDAAFDSPAITSLAGGGYVVAWRGYRFAGATAQTAIYARRFDAGGQPLDVEMGANTTTLGQVDGPAVTGLADGGFLIAWSSSTPNWSTTTVAFQRFDHAGTPVGGETVANVGHAGFPAGPDVAAMPDGSWIIAWTGAQAGAAPSILTRRYGSNGLPAGAEVTVAASTSRPEIAALSDGGYVIVWPVFTMSDYYYNGQRYDYALADLHARRYDGTGAALSAEMVFPTASNERDTELAGLGSGGFALAWRANTDPSDVGDIYVRQFKDALVGTDGSDWLQADDRFHVLLGAGGKDRLLGSASADWLDGGAADDFMAGGEGDDTYVVDSGGDIVLERPGEGRDTVRSSITYALPHDVENLVLTGSEPIDGEGNREDNVIIGNAAANRLSGGAGNDILDGGGGGDTFVFNAKLGPDNVDVMKNFIAGEDTIELGAQIFRALPSGPLNAAALAIGSGATTSNHRIVFDPLAKALLYDPDGSGSRPAVRFATLDGLVGTLSAANFVVR